MSQLRRVISRFTDSWPLTQQLESLLGYSPAAEAAAAPPPPPPTVMAEFLINSLGFSNTEALAVTKKVPASKSFRNDPNLVVGYLETLGLNKPQIKGIVTVYPRVLLPDPQKTFEPKIKALQDIGLSGSDLITVLTSYSSLLCRPLETDILAPIEYLTSVLGSKELVCKVILRHPSFLHVCTAMKLAPNITYLKKLGFSETNLSQMLILGARNLLREPPFLEEAVKMVENKYMISRSSKMFLHSLVVHCKYGAADFDKKFNVFRSFGWSEENIHVMFKHVPYIVGFSEDRLRNALDYYTGEVGYTADFLASHAVVLNYSLEKRVIPRVKIMKILMEKKLIDEKRVIPHTYLTMKDINFIKRFILPYLDDVTLSVTDLELLNNYILPHKDEVASLSASTPKLCSKGKKRDKKTE